MSLNIRYILSLLSIFPAIIGIYKYKKVNKLFHPFIFMMCLEVLAEIVDFLSKKPAIKSLCYVLLDCYTLLNFFLFLFLIFNFNFLSRKKTNALFIIAVVIAVVNFILAHPSGLLFYLICYVSAIMLVISIDIISKQIMAIKQPLLNNFWFWTSGTSIIYNAQLLLIFSIYFFALQIPILGNIITIINAICYILYAIAMLKIPEIPKARSANKKP